MQPAWVMLLSVSLLHFSLIDSSDLSHVSAEELKHFKQCVRGAQRSKLSECLGRSALNFIQRFEESENVSFVEDFVAVKTETASSRSLLNVLDTDPVDFRGILENAGAVMGQRSLEWHMDALYPGLMFKIGPTADANSVAEFVLDNGVQDERQFGYEDISTGGWLKFPVGILIQASISLRSSASQAVPAPLFAGAEVQFGCPSAAAFCWHLSAAEEVPLPGQVGDLCEQLPWSWWCAGIPGQPGRWRWLRWLWWLWRPWRG